RPVLTGVDVPVRGGDDGRILLAVLIDVAADARRDGGATVHGQAAPLAEVVLDVDDDQRSAHVSEHATPCRRRARPCPVSASGRRWSWRPCRAGPGGSCPRGATGR